MHVRLGAAVFAAILIFIGSHAGNATLAAHDSLAPNCTWYVGEGVKQGIYLTYRIQEQETFNGDPYELTIYFQELDEYGSWIAPAYVKYKDKVFSGTMILGDNLAVLEGRSDIPNEMKPFVGGYSRSLQWLEAFTARSAPLSLCAKSWGGLPEMSLAERMAPRGIESVIVPAGAFNTTLISWTQGQTSKIWVLDDFPFPIKALTYEKDAIRFAFELLELHPGEPIGGEWKIAYTVGKFLNSEPAKPDRIFKIQYRVMNGTVERFNAPYLETTAKVSSIGGGLLEIKFPKNYPYTNDINVSGSNAVILVNGQEGVPEYVVSDCFFLFSIPFTGSTEIGLAWTFLLIDTPHHGDNVPESCMPQTLGKDMPVRKDGTISALNQFRAGVAVEDIVCKEGLELVMNPSGKPYCVTPATAKKLTERWKM